MAGLCALTLLCGMSIFYYNLPIRVKSKDGTTDYTWEKNVFYSQFTEGFAWGKTDMNGYNNPKQYDNISILLMGSSQFEGHNVSQTDNFAYLFNQQMEESGKIFLHIISEHRDTRFTIMPQIYQTLWKFIIRVNMLLLS